MPEEIEAPIKVKEFTIDHVPIAKARPRVTSTGHAYTPKRTLDYERFVLSCYCLAYPEFDPFPEDMPISVRIECLMPIPKGTSKKKTAELSKGVPHVKKPDLDNLAKSILDALNQWAWVDDSQICELSISKRYGAEPKVIVRITEIAEEDGCQEEAS